MQTIIQKIQKLLALSTSDNPNEAALALSKAQKLLAEHNLSMLDVQEKQGKRSDAYGMRGIDLQSKNHWMRALLCSVARNNFCDVVYHPKRTVVHLIGEPENVEAVIWLFNHVLVQLECMAARELRVYRMAGGATHARTWKNSFFTGAMQVIHQRLVQERAEFEAAQNKNQALIVLKDTDLEEAKLRIFPDLKKGKLHTTLRSPDGYAQGQRAGSRVGFRREVGA